MSPLVPRLNCRDVERVRRENEFRLVSQRGSHRKWESSQSGKIVIVPEHGSKILALGTMASIMKGSGLPDEVWQ